MDVFKSEEAEHTGAIQTREHEQTVRSLLNTTATTAIDIEHTFEADGRHYTAAQQAAFRTHFDYLQSTTSASQAIVSERQTSSPYRLERLSTFEAEAAAGSSRAKAL